MSRTNQRSQSKPLFTPPSSVLTEVPLGPPVAGDVLPVEVGRGLGSLPLGGEVHGGALTRPLQQLLPDVVVEDPRLGVQLVHEPGPVVDQVLLDVAKPENINKALELGIDDVTVKKYNLLISVEGTSTLRIILKFQNILTSLLLRAIIDY